MDEENANISLTETGEQSSESDTQGNEAQTVEMQQIDYTDQLTIIQQQQQICIGVCCVLIGVMIVSMIFAILSRYI